jgi:hypothetical protein
MAAPKAPLRIAGARHWVGLLQGAALRYAAGPPRRRPCISLLHPQEYPDYYIIIPDKNGLWPIYGTAVPFVPVIFLL